MFHMIIRRSISLFLLTILLVVITGCGFFQEENLSSNSLTDLKESEVIEIEELENVEYFRQGALEHILQGEINRRGQAVGFHYEGLPSKRGEIVIETKTPLDEYGVYEAEVIIDDIRKEGNKGKSSFFPLQWNTQEVVDAINEAYEKKQFISGNTYEGLTTEGVVIRMYLDEKEQIISAFPIYDGE